MDFKGILGEGERRGRGGRNHDPPPFSKDKIACLGYKQRLKKAQKGKEESHHPSYPPRKEREHNCNLKVTMHSHTQIPLEALFGISLVYVPTMGRLCTYHGAIVLILGRC